MIEFKTLKYRHALEGLKLQKDIEEEKADTTDLVMYALGLVKAWDLEDENGPLTIPKTADEMLDGMTVEQVTELLEEFGRQFKKQNVPKEKAAP